MKSHRYNCAVMASLFLLSIVTACTETGQVPIPTITTIPSTSTPPPSTTPTSTPETPADPVSEMKARLGNDVTWVDSTDGTYQEIAIEGTQIPDLKFYADGTSSLSVKFEGKDVELVVADQVINRGPNGELLWGLREFKDGAWSAPITDAAPKKVEDRAKFRELVLIEGGPKYQEMLNTINMESVMALGEVNLADEFKGITIDDKYRGHIEDVDVSTIGWKKKDKYSSELGIMFVPSTRFDTNRDVSIVYRNPQMSPLRIVQETGYFNLKVLTAGSTVDQDLVVVPAVALNSQEVRKDRKILPLHGLMNMDGLNQAIDLLNQDNKRMNPHFLSPGFLVGTSLDKPELKWESKYDDIITSDSNLRILMAEVNHAYFVKHADDGSKYTSLPQDLSNVFFDFFITEPQPDLI